MHIENLLDEYFKLPKSTNRQWKLLDSISLLYVISDHMKYVFYT